MANGSRNCHAIAFSNQDRDEEPDRPERDRDDDEAPEIPPTEPVPVPVEEPPDAPGQRGPYVVECGEASEP
jgi:hypothetical protein